MVLTPQQRYLRQPMSQEEESSLLGSLGQGALTGLSYLGNWLDTPGSVARGLIAGRPDRALEGIFDWDKRVRGGDLTGNKDAPLFSWAGAGNIATEIGLDPLTYLSLGASAATKLGKLAGKAGVLPKTGALRGAGFAKGSKELGDFSKYLSTTKQYAGRTADEIAEQVAGKPLGGNVGFGLPFGMSDKITFDAAPALNAAGNVLTGIPGVGPLLSKAGTGVAAVGRHARAALDGRVKDALSAKGQALGMAFTNAERAAYSTAHKEFLKLYDTLPADVLTSERGAMLRSAAESTKQGPDEFARFVDSWGAKRAENLKALQEAGYPDQALHDDLLEYFPRQVHSEIAKRHAKLGFLPEKEAARQKILKGVETGKLNELFREEITHPTTLSLARHIQTKYLGVDMAKWDKLRATARDAAKAGEDVPDEVSRELSKLDALKVQSEHLADYKMDLGKLDFDYYGNHPLEDMFSKLVRDQTKLLQAKELHKAIADVARPAVGLAGDSVPLTKVLERAGLTYGLDVPKPSALAGTGEIAADATELVRERGAMQQTLDALRAATGNKALQMEDLAKFSVPREFADDISKVVPKLVSPKAVRPFLDAIGSITQITKAHQTLPWLAYHVRNGISGLWQSFMHDGFSLQSLKDAKAWQKGANAIDGLETIPEFAGMSKEAATKALYGEIIQNKIPMHKMMEHMTDVPATDRLLEILPGTARPGLKDAAKDLLTKKGWASPHKVAGAFGATEDVFPLVKAGRKAASSIDQINRVAMYIAKRRQGFNPEAAAREVIKAHYDFGTRTETERVAGMLVPFFGWTRHNLPAVIKELATNPGGKMGTAIRIAGKTRGSDAGLLPQQLGAGLAVPVGQPEPGTERFIGSLGLPFEDIGAWASNPATAALGSLNPLIKAPLEMFSGQQFFTGRDLRDLYSPTRTNNTVVDQIVMNSPLGRYVRTASTLADDRKGALAKAANLGTGVRVTDVDVTKEQNRAARNIITDMLRGQGRVSENFSIPPEVLATLSPEDLSRYRLYLNLRREAREAARARERASQR